MSKLQECLAALGMVVVVGLGTAGLGLGPALAQDASGSGASGSDGSGSGGSGSGEKSLANQWLDGDLPYDGPELTYDGPTINVRVAHFLAPDTPITQVLARAVERLHEESNGKFNLRVFYNNSLHDAQRGGFEGVAGGISDLSTCYSWINPGGFDLQLGLQLPFLFERATVGSATIMKLYDTYFRDEYEAQGVLMARSTITPPQQLLTRGEAIETLEDLAGKRTMASGELATDIVTALGGVPVPLTVSEYYSGFQQGVVDVMVIHDAGLKLFRFNELASNRTVVNLFSNPIEYCMNREFYDGLPDDMRELWELWLQKLNHAEAEIYFDGVAEQGRQEAEAAGIVTTELSEEEYQRWLDAVEPVVQDWIAENEEQGLPAQQMLEDLRATVEEYSAMSDDELFRLYASDTFEDVYPK